MGLLKHDMTADHPKGRNAVEDARRALNGWQIVLGPLNAKSDHDESGIAFGEPEHDPPSRKPTFQGLWLSSSVVRRSMKASSSVTILVSACSQAILNRLCIERGRSTDSRAVGSLLAGAVSLPLPLEM